MSKKKIKVPTNTHIKSFDYKFLLIIILVTFSSSVLFNMISVVVMPKASLWVSVFILLLFVFFGIVADMIGTAFATGSTVPFHSMAAGKVKGADIAVTLLKNSDKVSSFCNDVFGDIAGIISGAAVTILVGEISDGGEVDMIIKSLFITAFVVSLTVGGKALGKNFSIKHSNQIVYIVARVLYFLGFSKLIKKNIRAIGGS